MGEQARYSSRSSSINATILNTQENKSNGNGMQWRSPTHSIQMHWGKCELLYSLHLSPQPRLLPAVVIEISASDCIWQSAAE